MTVAELFRHFDTALLLDPKKRDNYGHIFPQVLELSKPANILEIGFFTGNSALCWLHLSRAKLTSVDPMVDVGGQQFNGSLDNVGVLKDFYGDRFSFVQKDSRLVRPDLAGQKFDLIFIDGDHSPDGVANDLQLAVDLDIPWVFVDDFSGPVAEGFASLSSHFEPVAEFNRYSVPQFVPMRLFKKNS